MSRTRIGAVAWAAMAGLLPSAHAQEVKWCCLDGSVLQATAAVCSRKNGKTTDTKGQALQVCTAAAPPPQAQQSPFFRPWIKPADQKTS